MNNTRFKISPRAPLGHYFEWVRLGSQLPDGHEVIRVHQREARPAGAGTNTEEWLLIEFRERQL